MEQQKQPKARKDSVLILAMIFFISIAGFFIYFIAEGKEHPNEQPVEKIEEKHPSEETVLPKDDEEDGELESEEEVITTNTYNFEYPDAVRGIYVTGNTVGVSRFDRLIDLVNSTDLNAMVIDIKEDHGYITMKLEGTDYDDISKNYIKDAQKMMEQLEEHNIYPIARIVVFKDSVLAAKRPDLSFTQNGHVWKNRRDEAFVNPFLKEVWYYNIEIAKMAAEMGFQEIQFDYVRFPEGFENRDTSLQYSKGDYSEEKLLPKLIEQWRKEVSSNVIGEENFDDVKNLKVPEYSNGLARVTAVTDFVEYAYKELQPYGVDVSVDIFGYAAIRPAAYGIGQDFRKISSNVDVISSMIYPSHWGPGNFGLARPDTEPYELIKRYIQLEKEILNELENPPTSRPWIQDFTAPWLGRGNYIRYGKEEVEAQIRALNEEGVHEYLLWNAGNSYTEGVDYTTGMED
ncbi:hypothetical protein GGQ84_001786 [Desulfitispora alkaliphila]|uniref:putative glycoside hydrolase n=1 Tax=Desulfitispora alkaliphila TaxID=622674 RepID=UPI003D246821